MRSHLWVLGLSLCTSAAAWAEPNKRPALWLPFEGEAYMVQGFKKSGIDLVVEKQAPVRASADGLVVFSGDSEKGPAVIVKHRQGWFTTYLGVTSSFKKGDAVAQGEALGIARYVHFEVRDPAGNAHDPLKFLKVRIDGKGKHRHTQDQLLSLLVEAGWPKHTHATMLCVAWWESSWRPDAQWHNDNKTYDTGLWQINDVNLKLCDLRRDQLFDPLTNARCALKVWQKQGYKAWVAYKDRGGNVFVKCPTRI